jgi:ABC-2 type transport system permease protein
MREAVIVLRRELRAYVQSPLAYVFGGAFLLLQLYACTELLGLLDHGVRADMTRFFRLLPWVYIVFLPGLAMRLWSEERKQGTLELLLTFPAPRWSLILGKFLAALAVIAALLALTIGVPLTLDSVAELDWRPVLGGYLAALLLAAAYLAVGMFFSSLTRDQLVAMLASFFTLLLLVGLGSGWGQLQLELLGLPVRLVGAVEAASPLTHFVSISRGVVDLGDLVFYVVFCGFFLHLNSLVLRAQQERG